MTCRRLVCRSDLSRRFFGSASWTSEARQPNSANVSRATCRGGKARLPTTRRRASRRRQVSWRADVLGAPAGRLPRSSCLRDAAQPEALRQRGAAICIVRRPSVVLRQTPPGPVLVGRHATDPAQVPLVLRVEVASFPGAEMLRGVWVTQPRDPESWLGNIPSHPSGTLRGDVACSMRFSAGAEGGTYG
jgi:hypothetical protein